MGLGQPAPELRHAAPAAGLEIFLQLGQGRAGEFAGPTGVVRARVVEQRVHTALAIGVKPGLDGGAGTARGLRNLIQSQFALKSQVHGQQALASRSGWFGVQPAGDEISLAATI